MKKDPDENPNFFRNPSERKLPYEDVVINASDNIKLHGWFIK